MNVVRPDQSCIAQAYARLSGAVGLVILNPDVAPALHLAALQAAYVDAEVISRGGTVSYATCARHRRRAHPCQARGKWNAIPG